MSYGGEELPLQYDELLHGGCCEPSSLNPQQKSSMIRFHARRDKTWYYVEADVSPAP